MSEYRGPLRFAHRGVGQIAPENTLEALQAAVEAGLEGIEIDVRLTRDGEVAIAHDDTMKRLSTGAQVSDIPISDMTAPQLRAVRIPYANHLLDHWKQGGFEDESRGIDQQRQLGLDADYPYPAALAADDRHTRPILLRELFDWMAAEKIENLWVEIECKSAGLAAGCAALLEDFPYRAHCILFSGEEPYIEELQQYEKTHGFPQGVKLGANIRWLTEEMKRRIADMTLYEVGLNDGHFSAEDVAWLHARDIRIFSNLGDYPAAWARVCDSGLDGLKTNFSEEYLKWWKTRNG